MSHDMDDTDEPETGDRTADTETNLATVRHEWRQSGDPSVALVEAVAAATDRTVTDLPPLQQSIDPDALDALLTGNQSSEVSISFRYADTAVSIHRNGSIELQVDGSSAQGDVD
jgi:hypothetical protein